MNLSFDYYPTRSYLVVAYEEGTMTPIWQSAIGAYCIGYSCRKRPSFKVEGDKVRLSWPNQGLVLDIFTGQVLDARRFMFSDPAKRQSGKITPINFIGVI